MDLPPGPSRSSRSRSSVGGSKNTILTDDELLRMLESDTLFSSEEEFVGDSDVDYLVNESKY